MFVRPFLVISIFLFLADSCDGVCCPTYCRDAGDCLEGKQICLDGKPVGYDSGCCEKGKCNIFCFDCDGGCRMPADDVDTVV